MKYKMDRSERTIERPFERTGASQEKLLLLCDGRGVIGNPYYIQSSHRETIPSWSAVSVT